MHGCMTHGCMMNGCLMYGCATLAPLTHRGFVTHRVSHQLTTGPTDHRPSARPRAPSIGPPAGTRKSVSQFVALCARLTGGPVSPDPPAASDRSMAHVFAFPAHNRGRVTSGAKLFVFRGTRSSPEVGALEHARAAAPEKRAGETNRETRPEETPEETMPGTMKTPNHSRHSSTHPPR